MTKRPTINYEVKFADQEPMLVKANEYSLHENGTPVFFLDIDGAKINIFHATTIPLYVRLASVNEADEPEPAPAPAAPTKTRAKRAPK